MQILWHHMVSVYRKKRLTFLLLAASLFMVSFLPSPGYFMINLWVGNGSSNHLSPQSFNPQILKIPIQTHAKKGKLTFHFINIANGKPIVLHDSVYSTTLGEPYTITKLRYYISNIELAGNAVLAEADNYQLIDAAKATSFSIPVKEGKYSGVKFLLGVDSLRNFSGAQTGALDPMNDMFWTWNSGYVMFKLEGYSDSSSATNNKVEHHIGGYRFGNNVARIIKLEFDEINIKEDVPVDIYIYMNLDSYWEGANHIRIAKDPVCTLPGELAKKIAANFNGLFSVKQVKQ